MSQQSYLDGLSACIWLNEHSEKHRVLNCRGDFEESRHDYWYVTENKTGKGVFTNSAQLTSLARVQGWKR